MHDEGETEGERETEGAMDKREEGEEGEESEEEEGEEGEEIEVGEVAERTRNAHSRGRKLHVEDREEGEASDESSVLSEPPEL
jgi:X-linked retinitis pigmentosa GTPase regulator